MKKGIQFIRKYKKIIFCLLALMIISLLFMPLLNELINNPEYFKQMGILGKGLLIVVMSLQVIVAFIPGEVVELLAGVLYGPLEGTLLCLLGAALGSSLIYFLSVKLGEKLFNKEGKEKTFYQTHQITIPLIFILFLLPGSPKDALTYFMPMTSIKLSSFLLVSSVARIPSVLSSTLTGSVWKQGNFVLSILIYGLTAFLSLGGYWIYKRMTRLEGR